MTPEERIADLENVLLQLQAPLAEMPDNLDYGNRASVANGCLTLIWSTLQKTEQGRGMCERIAHLEQQRDHLQTRNTALVELNRSQQVTLAAHERCAESLRQELTILKEELSSARAVLVYYTTQADPRAARQWLNEHPDPAA